MGWFLLLAVPSTILAIVYEQDYDKRKGISYGDQN